MRIRELLDTHLVLCDMAATDKKAALTELCAPLAAQHPSLDREQMVRVLLERERLGSTGVGAGVAIPHGKLPQLGELLAVFGRSQAGVEFASIDDAPAHLFFVLFAPEDAAAMHLKALARISRLLKMAEFRETLLQATSPDQVLDAIAAAEAQI